MFSVMTHFSQAGPPERTFHRSVVVQDKVYIWGGLQDDLPEVHDSPQKQEFLSEIDVFELRTGAWENITTIGEVPLGVAAYACTAVGDLVYYFGGLCGHGEDCLHNSLSSLNTKLLKWTEIVPTTESVENSPMRKTWCGMVPFKSEGDLEEGEEDLLLVVGGHGIFPKSKQPGADYIPDEKNGDSDSDDDEEEEETPVVKGRTNEHHIMSLQNPGQSIVCDSGNKVSEDVQCGIRYISNIS